MSWAIERTTDQADLPLTLEELKDHVRVRGTEDDATLYGLLRSATEYIEGVLGRSLVTQTWQLTLDQFPSSRLVRLPMGPVQSVTSVRYTPTDDSEQTFAASKYTLWAANDSLSLKIGESWPGVVVEPGGIVIEYVAGVSREDVPEDEKLLIKLLAAHWYLHPEAVITGTISSELPLGFHALLHSRREIWQGP